jgi:DNA-binding response OmpR family regulator
MEKAGITTLRILLVEDEDLVVSVLEETLREGGFEPEVAKSGGEAFTLLESKIGSIRGLITDINLGSGPDGWDVARHARELSPEIPVVYMSGASSDEWTSRGVPNSTIVEKPFAPAQIITAISALLNTTDR